MSASEHNPAGGSEETRAGSLSWVAEHVADAFWLADAETGAVLYANPACEKAWGVGDPARWLDSARPEDRPLAAKALRPDNGPSEAEFRLGAPDDPAPRWLRVKTCPIPPETPGGRPKIAGLAIDVTRDKQAAESLRRAEAKRRALLEGLLEQSPAGVLVVEGPDMRVSFSNASAALGGDNPWRPSMDAFEAFAQGGWKVYYPDGRELPDKEWPLARAFRDGEIIRGFEIRIVREADGHEAWFLLNAAPIQGQSGGSSAAMVVFLDITQNKLAEQRRLRLETRLGDAERLESLAVLAGGVAHDFNNILVGILGNAGLAQMELPEDSPARETVKHIETSALRAAELTRLMLAYSGRGRFVAEPLDLAELARETALLAEDALKAKGAALAIEAEPGLSPVKGDAAQIRQAVACLVANAVEAVENVPGATVRVRAAALAPGQYAAGEKTPTGENPPGPRVLLQVSDNGRGFDLATRAKMFEPFFSTKPNGRGLGLAAVAGIARGHRGSIAARGFPGKGSVFSLAFPAFVSEANGSSNGERPGAETKASPEPGAPKGGALLLVVDDEPDARLVAAKTLRKAGFDVLEASSGEEAARIFRERHAEIACSLLDMTMPGMNGAETFEAMRAIDPNAKAVLVSGFSREDASERFGAGGLSGFVQKPFLPKDLAAKVRQALTD